MDFSDPRHCIYRYMDSVTPTGFMPKYRSHKIELCTGSIANNVDKVREFQMQRASGMTGEKAQLLLGLHKPVSFGRAGCATLLSFLVMGGAHNFGKDAECEGIFLRCIRNFQGVQFRSVGFGEPGAPKYRHGVSA
jgi:hypothetical protein